MKKNRTEKLLFGISKFVMFFLLIAFVVSTSFILFLHYLDFTPEEIREAAPITFINVIFISLLFWIIDIIRRKILIEMPIRRINEGLEKLTKGEFDVRISQSQFVFGRTEYNDIINGINKMAQELSGVETLRTDFVSNVSHEMKTPLAVIRNYSALLKAEKITDIERIEYANAIEEASGRLAGLITNILKLSKLENQQIYPDSKVYNLSEQLCGCLLEFENEWEKKGLDIETDIAEDADVNADPELLSLVWNNLFSNAVKFTDEGGTIKLSLNVDSEYAEVSVADTGCGIDSATGRHIFDKFYQGDTSHTAKGNGLGLALVKRIIDITGSDISVQSELGKGSVFTVKIRRNINEKVFSDIV